MKCLPVNLLHRCTFSCYVCLYMIHIQCSARLCYLGYDRACDLKPYLEKQARQGGAGEKLMHFKWSFWLMHFTARTIQNLVVCHHPTLNASSTLPFQSSRKYMELTQRAVHEQGFCRLNKYKGSTSHMTQFKRNLFFYYVNNLYNGHLEDNLKLLK